MAAVSSISFAEEIPGMPVAGENGDVEQVKLLRITEEKANEQLDFLMEKTLGKTIPQLVASGTFFPYAAVLRPNGEVKYMRVSSDSTLAGPAVIQILRESLKATADTKKIIGSVLYYLSSDVSKGKDNAVSVVAVELEHAYGIAKGRAISFEVDGSDIEFGDGAEKVIPARVFIKP